MIMVMVTKARDTQELADALAHWAKYSTTKPGLIVGPHELVYSNARDPNWTEEHPKSQNGDTVYRYDGVRVQCLCDFNHDNRADMGCDDEDDD